MGWRCWVVAGSMLVTACTGGGLTRAEPSVTVSPTPIPTATTQPKDAAPTTGIAPALLRHGSFVFVAGDDVPDGYTEADRVASLTTTDRVYPLADSHGSQIWLADPLGADEGIDLEVFDAGAGLDESTAVLLSSDGVAFPVGAIVAVDRGLWLLSAEEDRARAILIDGRTLEPGVAVDLDDLATGLTTGLVPSESEDVMYLGTREGAVVTLDANTGALLETISVGSAAVIGIEEFFGQLVVATGSGSAYTIDPGSGTVVPFFLPDGVTSIGAERSTRLLAVVGWRGSLWLFDSLHSAVKVPTPAPLPGGTDLAVLSSPHPPTVVVSTPGRVQAFEADSYRP